MTKRPPLPNAFGSEAETRSRAGCAPARDRARAYEGDGYAGGVVRDSAQDFADRAAGQQAPSTAPFVSPNDLALGQMCNVPACDPEAPPTNHRIFKRQ